MTQAREDFLIRLGFKRPLEKQIEPLGKGPSNKELLDKEIFSQGGQGKGSEEEESRNNVSRAWPVVDRA